MKHTALKNISIPSKVREYMSLHKRKLSDTTLMIADTYNYGGAVASLKKCMSKCDFDKVIFFTNIPLKVDGVDVIQIDELSGKDGYSHFMLKEAWKYIDTKFVLVVQHDSWVLDENQFDEQLYNVDYCGALWLENDGLSNGNGGFSWRSYRLMKTVGTDPLINATTPEDVSLCRVYRRYLEKNYDFIWANDDLCEKFSFELRCPTQQTFGFHNFFHPPYKPTVVIIRKAALGDVVMVEPVMRYFNDKGYRVVLDTLPQFQLLFLNHYFQVHKLDGIDQRLLAKAKFVNLDMSYESIPKQLHLKSYFEYAGISEEEYTPYLTSPKLSVGFPLTKETKLFNKCCILHVDNRAVEQGRNIEGVNWELVVNRLNELGYTAIQVGNDDTAIIKNAVKINCTNNNFLCYVCGSADLMIGIDSGISNICSAFNVPCIILSGSVNMEYIHPDMSNKIWIHNHDKKPCSTPFCWHDQIGVSAECSVNKKQPPCMIFDTNQVLNALYNILLKQKTTV
jgi:ADP-heptose:LPS heptosyltransferase